MDELVGKADTHLQKEVCNTRQGLMLCKKLESIGFKSKRNKLIPINVTNPFPPSWENVGRSFEIDQISLKNFLLWKFLNKNKKRENRIMNPMFLLASFKIINVLTKFLSTILKNIITIPYEN